MDDLIRRSDAIEAIEVVDWYHQNRNKDMVNGANSDEHQAWYKADDVYKALEAVPSADRPKGEWIDKGKNLWKCSNCEMVIYSESEQDRNEFHKWCSRCGARMKGADDYERAIEQMEHDMLYETTYNPEDGSM